MRQEYTAGGLSKADVLADPIAQFERWFDEAQRADPRAQRDDARHRRHRWPAGGAHGPAEGRRSARPDVLHQPRQPQGRELAAQPQAALVFWWPPQGARCASRARSRRSTRPRPTPISRAGPRGSQIGAWASAQSSVVADREALEAASASIASAVRGGRGAAARRSGAATGWCPPRVEFWQGRINRLHDRLRYTRRGGGLADRALAP